MFHGENFTVGLTFCGLSDEWVVILVSLTEVAEFMKIRVDSSAKVSRRFLFAHKILLIRVIPHLKKKFRGAIALQVITNCPLHFFLFRCFFVIKEREKKVRIIR